MIPVLCLISEKYLKLIMLETWERDVYRELSVRGVRRITSTNIHINNHQEDDNVVGERSGLIISFWIGFLLQETRLWPH